MHSRTGLNNAGTKVQCRTMDGLTMQGQTVQDGIVQGQRDQGFAVQGDQAVQGQIMQGSKVKLQSEQSRTMLGQALQ